MPHEPPHCTRLQSLRGDFHCALRKRVLLQVRTGVSRLQKLRAHGERADACELPFDLLAGPDVRLRPLRVLLLGGVWLRQKAENSYAGKVLQTRPRSLGRVEQGVERLTAGFTRPRSCPQTINSVKKKTHLGFPNSLEVGLGARQACRAQPVEGCRAAV